MVLIYGYLVIIPSIVFMANNSILAIVNVYSFIINNMENKLSMCIVIHCTIYLFILITWLLIGLVMCKCSNIIHSINIALLIGIIY